MTCRIYEVMSVCYHRVLSKEIDDMGEWTDNQKLRIKQQVNDLVQAQQNYATQMAPATTPEISGATTTTDVVTTS